MNDEARREWMHVHIELIGIIKSNVFILDRPSTETYQIMLIGMDCRRHFMKNSVCKNKISDIGRYIHIHNIVSNCIEFE